MVIYKFGGASLSSASSFGNLAGIISRHKGKLVIVVSAFGKTTNALEKLLSYWYAGSNDRFHQLKEIKRYHMEITGQLFRSCQQPALKAVSDIFSFLEAKLRISPSGNYDFDYDQMVSQGELISTRIVSAFLDETGIRNCWTDARKWLITDANYREADVNWELTVSKTREIFNFEADRIYLTQGFIGGTVDGFPTTLGREGSDYSASVLGNILDAREIVFWKDVPGVLTADPRYFPEAEKLDEISYQEAIELSFYGAKVIHPKTIKPLQNKDIPLYVRSFYEPGIPGTHIHRIDKVMNLKPILIIKQDQILISLTPRDLSFIVEDCLSRIFALFFKYRMKVNLLQHSAITFTICMDNTGPFAGRLLEEMRSDFRVLYNQDLELITIRHYTPGDIEKHTRGRQVFVEQRSRSTVMFVVR